MSWVSRCYFSLIGCAPVAAYGLFFKKYWLKLSINGFYENVSCSILSNCLWPHGLEACHVSVSSEARGFLCRWWLSLLRASQGQGCGKGCSCQCRRLKRCGFSPWVWKIPWRRAWQPTQRFLAWKILWTEEPGRLLPVGSQRVEHDWSDLACTCILLKWLFGVMFIGIQRTLGVL